MKRRISLLHLSSLVALLLFPCVEGTAQTVHDWLHQYHDPNAGNGPFQQLTSVFQEVAAEAAAHYRDNGDVLRATAVQPLMIDFYDLGPRLRLADSTVPTASLKSVVKGYLIDASAAQSPRELIASSLIGAVPMDREDPKTFEALTVPQQHRAIEDVVITLTNVVSSGNGNSIISDHQKLFKAFFNVLFSPRNNCQMNCTPPGYADISDREAGLAKANIPSTLTQVVSTYVADRMYRVVNPDTKIRALDNQQLASMSMTGLIDHVLHQGVWMREAENVKIQNAFSQNMQLYAESEAESRAFLSFASAAKIIVTADETRIELERKALTNPYQNSATVIHQLMDKDYVAFCEQLSSTWARSLPAQDKTTQNALAKAFEDYDTRQMANLLDAGLRDNASLSQLHGRMESFFRQEYAARLANR